MKNNILKDFKARCLNELTGDNLPFWMRYGYDRINGGVYTCLDRDGTLMDSTKSVWFQGRFGYILSYAYCNVAKNEEWLEAAKGTLDFIERNCFDSRARMYFEVAADGTPLRMRRYLFSEAFAAIAHAQYAKATGERAHADRALALFRSIRAAAGDPSLCPPKYESALEMQGHSLTMILINTANVLAQVCDDPVLEEQINESIDSLFRYFVKPQFRCILESVGPNGEFIDTCAGRTINPGHGIETAWFLMDVAKKRDDQALLDKALQLLDWQWDWGWDAEQGGGIISFRDCRGFPPQCYEQDMKFWWPQCEAIIANLEAYALTGEEKWFERFLLVRDWAWKHLKDPDHPEWFGYLHRDGTVAQPAKGNLFKGPFHIPRMLIKCASLCDEITAVNEKQ